MRYLKRDMDQKTVETKKDYRKYFLRYTVCFLLAGAVIFIPFYISKRGGGHADLGRGWKDTAL